MRPVARRSREDTELPGNRGDLIRRGWGHSPPEPSRGTGRLGPEFLQGEYTPNASRRR
jgi:hypothetical protein